MAVTGTLYIISAPSGGGKTSLVNALIASMNEITVSISYTTRVQRSGEQDKIDYHFIDDKQFQELSQQGALLEEACVFGNHYATGKQWVTEKLESGQDVILEIDWQGAQQIRRLMPECIGIFILPPSREALYSRLKERAQDDLVVIEKRMAQASNEIIHYQEYDYLVINDDFEQALNDLKCIIRANRLLCHRQQKRYSNLINNL
ncbi:MAG: Guanylate kinase [Legionellaceae bacterium]